MDKKAKTNKRADGRNITKSNMYSKKKKALYKKENMHYSQINQ